MRGEAVRKLFVCVFALFALLFDTSLVAQQPLPITQVLLYKNGMAYVVRSGQLTAPLNLTFHPEDMNDVLKSFTAWNPDTNGLYSVGYTAGIPSNHMLRRFPFDVAGADVGLSGFLTQVKGADVRLAMAANAVQGKLMAVQQAERVVTQQTASRDHRLTILLRSGSLQTVWLSDVRTIEFADAQLREQLRSYLDVLAEGRQDVTREVSVYPTPSSGPIRVAYLQQFPLWKTSYRIDMGDKESQVQGWAQIDNPTGESWNNVEVSLLSGAPVSFVMNLYEPLYTNRATVSVPGAQVAAPRQYETALSQTMPATVAGRLAAAPPPPQVGRGGAGSGAGTGGGIGGGTFRGSVAESITLSAGMPVSALEFNQAEALQLQDAFEYKFPFPVQLGSRQSALLPFVQKKLSVERLSIFNVRSDRGYPRLGARLENTTGVPFEPGPVTFFESGKYAGESVLPHVARGDKQLVSYGIDQDVAIAAKQESRPATMTRLTISRGVAVLFSESVATHTYEIRNKGAEKTLLIEHPRMSDRKLKGASPWETTDNFYRFRLTLPAEGSTQLPVSEVLETRTQVSLDTLRRDQLVMFAANATPQVVRERLGQIVDTQEQIGAFANDVGLTRTKTDALYQDQERLRENLKALGNRREEQELRRRYLDQLSRQESEIEQLRAQTETLSARLSEAQNRLRQLVANLSFEP
jgi:hypothetical protein